MDQLDIAQTIHRYALAVDTEDWTLLDEAFTADAFADYTDVAHITGDDCELHGREAIAAWLQRHTGGRDTQHVMTNHVIDLDGDTATMRNYMIQPNGSRGIYTTEVVRTPDGWRIARLKLSKLADGT